MRGRGPLRVPALVLRPHGPTAPARRPTVAHGPATALGAVLTAPRTLPGVSGPGGYGRPLGGRVGRYTAHGPTTARRRRPHGPRHGPHDGPRRPRHGPGPTAPRRRPTAPTTAPRPTAHDGPDDGPRHGPRRPTTTAHDDRPRRPPVRPYGPRSGRHSRWSSPVQRTALVGGATIAAAVVRQSKDCSRNNAIEHTFAPHRTHVRSLRCERSRR